MLIYVPLVLVVKMNVRALHCWIEKTNSHRPDSKHLSMLQTQITENIWIFRRNVNKFPLVTITFIKWMFAFIEKWKNFPGKSQNECYQNKIAPKIVSCNKKKRQQCCPKKVT